MNVHQSNLMRGMMLIGGELVPSEGGEWLESVNPATEETLGHVPHGTAAGVTLDFYAGFHTEIKGETIPASSKNLHFTIREPYGVVGRIIPFNHPIKFAANALAAPLMAGNCVVLKPPETSPLSATMLGEICREVLPAGVVNIVTGLGLPAGDAIARHPNVKRIAFTGSVPTGRAIQRAAAEGGIKHVTLELGGKNPLIAFPDMDPDTVAKIAVAGMNFAWQGQSCGSTSRLLLHEDLYKPVLERVVERVKSLRLANSTEYGLTASIFTNDLKTAFRTARAVKSGYIWINGASGHFYGTPFGGFKNSGLGREEGIDELMSYTEVKTIHVMLGDIVARD